MVSKNELKKVRSLSQKKYREKTGHFIAEGKRVLLEAVAASYSIETLFFTRSFSRRNKKFLEKFSCLKTLATEEEMKLISSSVTPPGILAVCPLPVFNTNTIYRTASWLFLDGVSDHGNMGTLLRTAVWFNIKVIGLSPDCCDHFNPKVVRGAMGAHFYLDFIGEIQLELFKSSHQILGADYRGERLADVTTDSRHFILIVGNEAHGISDKHLTVVDKTISIPKIGRGESLNVGVAAGILLHSLSK